MGTGSSENICYVISGQIDFDYETILQDNPLRNFRRKLYNLCSEYDLEVREG